MNADTLVSLESSIEKWRKIVDGVGYDDGAGNCALCVKFNCDSKRCRGCPVAERTGMRGCLRTPYTAWQEFWDGQGVMRVGRGCKVVEGDVEAKRLAQDELEFLISLRPE